MDEKIEEWLDRAREDLDDAEFNLKGDRYRLACFLCQQAAEKALKAVYIKKFKKLMKTHDLVILGREVNLPEKLIGYCKELSPAYMYSRYPDVIEVSNLDEIAEVFLSYAKEVLTWSEKQI